MDLAELVLLLLRASIAMMVVALGLGTNIADVFDLLRRPGQLLRSLLAMNLVMPAAAIAIAYAFNLHPTVKIALVTLALSPVPPVLPRKQIRAGGRSSYVFGLLVTTALFSVVFAPLAVEVIERVFAVPLELSSSRVAAVVVVTVLAPLALGLVARGIVPAAAGLSKPLERISIVLLAGVLVVVLVKSWAAMMALVGNGTLAAFAAFVVIGLTVGHLLGGPDPGDRMVLAIATASRHAGVALAIATANFPEQTPAVPALLLFMLTSAVLSVPYMKWFPSHGVPAGRARAG